MLSRSFSAALHAFSFTVYYIRFPVQRHIQKAGGVQNGTHHGLYVPRGAEQKPPAGQEHRRFRPPDAAVCSGSKLVKCENYKLTEIADCGLSTLCGEKADTQNTPTTAKAHSKETRTDAVPEIRCRQLRILC